MLKIQIIFFLKKTKHYSQVLWPCYIVEIKKKIRQMLSYYHHLFPEDMVKLMYVFLFLNKRLLIKPVLKSRIKETGALTKTVKVIEPTNHAVPSQIWPLPSNHSPTPTPNPLSLSLSLSLSIYIYIYHKICHSLWYKPQHTRSLSLPLPKLFSHYSLPTSPPFPHPKTLPSPMKNSRLFQQTPTPSTPHQ